MTVDDLLEELQQQPRTADVVVRSNAHMDDVSIACISYAYGQTVIVLEDDEADDQRDAEREEDVDA